MQSLRILLAEDNEYVRLGIGQLMKRTPHELTMVENGEKALGEFKKDTYDLVLMDIQMPVMDGLNAARAIRIWEKEHGHKPVPIIALTASGQKEDVENSMQAGCTLHVTKPVTKEELFKAIDAQSMAFLR